jgi:hypothetical protein
MLLLSTCCKNDDNSCNGIDCLPPATQTGENTIGYLVNEEPISVTNSNKMTAIYQQGQLQFGGGIDNSETDIGLGIILSDPINVNVDYDLTNYPTYAAQFGKREDRINCSYAFENTYQGSVTFTKIDRTNYIISGSFEFSTVTDNCETINITNGRFDMKYIP